jgi:hypothetical protein
VLVEWFKWYSLPSKREALRSNPSAARKKKKNGEQEGKTDAVWGRRGDTSVRGEDVRKGCRRVNMVEILRTHV